jgi:uncharacterized protein (DUF58 family)
VEKFIPPGRGQDHALRIVRDLMAIDPTGRGTRIGEALRFAQRVLARRGIVALLSDFQDQDFERPMGILRRRHDVMAIHLSDPKEREIPNVGMVALIDPETGDRIVVDTANPEVRRRLQAAPSDATRDICRRIRVDLLALSIAESYDVPLSGFFKGRGRRR